MRKAHIFSAKCSCVPPIPLLTFTIRFEPSPFSRSLSLSRLADGRKSECCDPRTTAGPKGDPKKSKNKNGAGKARAILANNTGLPPVLLVVA